jgi:hypothetical protein
VSRRTGILLGLLAAAVFALVLTYGMFSLRQHRVEVCLEWNGRSECAKAAGTSKEEATRTATEKACALLAGGMTDSMNCGRSAPTRITFLD